MCVFFNLSILFIAFFKKNAKLANHGIQYFGNGDFTLLG